MPRWREITPGQLFPQGFSWEIGEALAAIHIRVKALRVTKWGQNRVDQTIPNRAKLACPKVGRGSKAGRSLPKRGHAPFRPSGMLLPNSAEAALRKATHGDEWGQTRAPSRLLKNSAKWDRQIDPVVLRCSQH